MAQNIIQSSLHRSLKANTNIQIPHNQDKIGEQIDSEMMKNINL